MLRKRRKTDCGKALKNTYISVFLKNTFLTVLHNFFRSTIFFIDTLKHYSIEIEIKNRKFDKIIYYKKYFLYTTLNLRLIYEEQVIVVRNNRKFYFTILF